MDSENSPHLESEVSTVSVFAHVLESDLGDIESIHVGAGVENGGQSIERDDVDGDPMFHRRHRQPRTYISAEQRAILEDYFQERGMVSVSTSFLSLMDKAAAETKLELPIIKNWIRNRQRKARQNKEGNKDPTDSPHLASDTAGGVNDTQMLSMIIPSESPATCHVIVPQTSGSPARMVMARLPTPANQQPADELSPPNPKRHNPGTLMVSPLITNKIKPTFNSLKSSATMILQPKEPFEPLTVKVRIFESGELDFIEVDLDSMSYDGLLKSVCQELALNQTQVLKIRKLPNVLIRKDKDVLRLANGQELEVVLRTSI